MANPKMIIGLGNPGPRYAHNRHNIGFQCVDLFARRHRFEGGRTQLRAAVIDGWVSRSGSATVGKTAGAPAGSERVKTILVKPMTYMNASGEAVAPLARFYQVEPSDIIVVHDDLDMDAGKVRLRRNGSSGGQNGIKSIIQHLGTQEFHRAKIGIGRPPGRMDPAAYVLLDFDSREATEVAILREKVVDALECWLFDGIEAAMNRFNS